jgi:hypothetical protein
MNMDMERFIVRKLKEHYQVTIKSKYAALENLKRIMGASIGHGTL